MRRRTRTALATAALATLALGACADPASDAGSGGGDGGGQNAVQTSGPDDATSNDYDRQPPSSTSPPSGTPLPAQLSITVDDGTGKIATYSLSCEPAGGDHPDPAAACASLAAAGTEAFAPADPDLACTEIYGGPQTATVTGSLDGTQVNSAYNRTDGCQIARWDALADVFASAGGA